MAALTDSVVKDPRVKIEICDIAKLVKDTANGEQKETFDAIVFDLYKGPHFRTDKINDPLYGSKAIANVYSGLKPGGYFTVWGENYDERFDQRLKSAGFVTSHQRPGRGGYRHVVFIAKKGTAGKVSQ